MFSPASKWITHISGFIISFCIIIWMIHWAGVEKVFKVLPNISLGWLWVSLMVYCVSWLPRSLRFCCLADKYTLTISAVESFMIQASRDSLNNILPAKAGEISQFAYLKFSGLSGKEAFNMTVTNRLLDIFAIMVILASTYFIQYFSISTYLIIITFLLFLLMFKKNLQYIVFLSVMIWIFEGLATLPVVYAYNVDLSVFAVILAVMLANLGKSIPALPGGVGLYESAMVFALTTLGLDEPTALLISISDHCIKKCFTLSSGIFSIYFLKRTIPFMPGEIFQVGKSLIHPKG